jgi:exonuclease III
MITETHLAQDRNAPVIPGYQSVNYGATNRSKGVAIYHLQSVIAAQTKIPHTNARMIAIDIGDITYMTAYAPVNSAPTEKRERFYTKLQENLEAIIQ